MSTEDISEAVLERIVGPGASMQIKAGLFIIAMLLCIGLSALIALLATGTIP